MTDFKEFLEIVAIIATAVSPVLVAIFKNRKLSKETLNVVAAMQKDLPVIKSEMELMKSASRTGLQTQILEKCKRIQIALKSDKDYEEELKQLIILYKEYHACGFNSQGKLYFNDTIELVSENNNVMVRELMNTLFPEYEP